MEAVAAVTCLPQFINLLMRLPLLASVRPEDYRSCPLRLNLDPTTPKRSSREAR